MKKVRWLSAAVAILALSGCVTPPLVTGVREEAGEIVVERTTYIPMPWWWIEVSSEESPIDPQPR